MPGFGDRVNEFRHLPSDAYRQQINAAARLGIGAEIDTMERRVISKGIFKGLGIGQFLEDATRFARVTDGHKDPELVFDYHRPLSDHKTEMVRIFGEEEVARQVQLLRRGVHPSEVIDLSRIDEAYYERVAGLAIVDLRWAFVYGEAANGYNQVRLGYYPTRGVVEVAGAKSDLFWAIPGETADIEKAIVVAYHDPFVQRPSKSSVD